MIDIRKLKELVKLMVENDLTELDLRANRASSAPRRKLTRNLRRQSLVPSGLRHQSQYSTLSHTSLFKPRRLCLRRWLSSVLCRASPFALHRTPKHSRRQNGCERNIPTIQSHFTSLNRHRASGAE